MIEHLIMYFSELLVALQLRPRGRGAVRSAIDFSKEHMIIKKPAALAF